MKNKSAELWRRLSTVAVAMLVLPWIMGATGCPNVFGSLANKTSDDALLFQAQIYADQKAWTTAIKTVQLMTTAGLASTSTKVFLASLYAGRCGLDVVSMANVITNNLGTYSLWPVLKIAMSGATASGVADCKTAEQTILATLTFTDLTADDNVFLAFLEFAKIGAILAADGVDSTNSGKIVAGACAAPPSPGLLSDADVEELAASVMVAVEAMTTSGSKIAGAAATSVTSMCSTLTAAPYNMSNPCSSYTAADWAAGGATVIAALHVLVNSSDVGYNYNSCGTIGSGTCTCP